MSREPGQLKIQQYFTGELDEYEALEVKEHIENCKECCSFMTALENERKKFLNLHPFEEFERNALPGKPSLKSADIFSFKIHRLVNIPVAVTAMLLIFVPLILYNSNRTGDELYRFKGENEIQFFYKRDGVVGRGSVSQTFYAGDRLQILYSSKGNSYVALFSIDTEGQISFYHPDQNSKFCTVASESGSDLHFPSSIILDDRGERELVVLLHTDSPQRVEDVREWVMGHSGADFSDLSALVKKLLGTGLSENSSVATLLITKGKR